MCWDERDNNCDGEIDEGCVPNGCADGEFNGHSYLICQGQLTQPESAAFCGDLGMELAFVADEAENVFLVDRALEAFGYVNFEETSYWIGNLKSDAGYLPWASGEPNGASDECIHILRYDNPPYGWNDAGCDEYTWGWTCESVD